MDAFSLAASVVDSIAWPIVAGIALLALRKPLVALIPHLRQLRYGELEANFGHDLERIGEQIEEVDLPDGPPELQPVPSWEKPPATWNEYVDRLSSISPHATVLEAWRRVELSKGHYLAARSMGATVSHDVLAARLSADPRFPSALVPTIQQLKALRDDIAHRESISALQKSEAMEFAHLANQVAGAFLNAAP